MEGKEQLEIFLRQPEKFHGKAQLPMVLPRIVPANEAKRVTSQIQFNGKNIP